MNLQYHMDEYVTLHLIHLMKMIHHPFSFPQVQFPRLWSTDRSLLGVKW
jgi:hypothetical protein